MTRSYIAVLLFFAHCVLCFDDETAEKVRKFVNGLNECRGTPGAAVTLVKDNEVVFAEGFGLANIENEEPVTEDTKFAIASISKQFTTVMLAKLFEEDEKLSWDSNVYDALGDFYFVDGYRTNNTNFRDLAAHRTGIPRNDPAWVYGELTRDDIIERVRFHEAAQPFRLMRWYTNNMYSVAGKLTEVERGQSWEQAVREELLEPLGMDSTGFYQEGPIDDFAGWVTPYISNLLGGRPDDLVPSSYDVWMGSEHSAPAAGIVSTARDMGSWLLFLLNGGITKGGDRIMANTSIAELWEPQIQYDTYQNQIFGRPNVPASHVKSSYGLGFTLGYHRGYRLAEHGGTLNGFHSLMATLPDMGIGTFFTCNNGKHTMERNVMTIFLLDMLLLGESFLDVESACQLLEDHDSQYTHVSMKELQDLKAHIPFNGIYEVARVKAGLDLTADDVHEYALFHMVGEGMPAYLLEKMSSANSKIKLRSKNTSYKTSLYVGTYGNFIFGNLTVVEADQNLRLRYGTLGVWNLELIEDHVFWGTSEFNTGYGFYMIASFTEVGDEARFVTLPDILGDPVFERGLSMDQAPPPNMDCK